MKHLVILGAGTAGTIVANASRRRLPAEWEVIVVDPSIEHLYQPGLVFVPFGGTTELKRPRVDTLKHGVDWVRMGVDDLDPIARKVSLSNGEALPFDLLVVATGCRVRPDLLEGLTGEGWGSRQHEFYTLEGARKLGAALAAFDGGRVVINVVEEPIKGPLAPVEFAFLLDERLTRRGLRGTSEIVYATPSDAVFTRPRATERLTRLLVEKGVRLVTGFHASAVDGSRGVLRSFDGREEPYDLLVSVPAHTGPRWVELGEHGSARGFLAVDPRSLRARGMEGVFVVGDAAELASSNAGSVAHFQAEVLVADLVRIAEGRSPVGGYDGHATCFVETGHGRAMLIDFNDDVEPTRGRYPIPVVGPFTRLEETRRNHWGKLAFEWMYWNGLLPAHPMPVPKHLATAREALPPAMHRPY